MSFGSLHNRLTTDVACTCSSPRSHVLGRSYKVSERGIRQHWRIKATSLRQFNGDGSLTSVTTPHSGYHFDGSRDRFFEGWYWKVSLGGPGESFAFIYSIEDPKGNTQTGGVGAQACTSVPWLTLLKAHAQIMGPGDSYLLQYSNNVGAFWADQHSLALGARFRAPNGQALRVAPQSILPQDAFDRSVDQGYQASQTWHQGSLVADEAGARGDLRSTVPSAQWAFSVTPIDGWGPRAGKQQATAGWLAALPVFEPHWQILMARGTASGWVQWGNRRYEFTDAPAYAEKNWGAGFPKKWFWVVATGFEGEPDASLTAVGARRGLLQLPGVEEDVGMVGIHWKGQFIEMVPWNGDVQWEVEPWGRWRIYAKNSQYEALVEAGCSSPGTPLRAPTADRGLDVFCRDSFHGEVRLRVWRRDSAGVRRTEPLIDLHTNDGAVEVGGGPWWSTWQAQAEMQQPLKSIVGLPVDVESVVAALPQALRPPGL
ncbi:tocopherol cyclase [Coccomyxa subellipsoidea C-169]|uniref:Tocopherol cyclase n=1 Tax=Coccomyxa subellipsoidea (strain C-169) TaxID=574566 RepID=I0Z7Y5_COCSC|nr:tocopherol cyclase [Coccomyxa subellipsoidea C-169]EIE26754.1 tocopherol cyclase [Coccomyxa subellipsoidea C-169]|eukprot:XP_005651298.1 tocopherol cyclase [Coccomyxa subellipsoidea C-169]